jgi:uncharacterized membrane protein YkoI
MWKTLSTLTLALAAGLMPLHAKADSDHDRARAALLAGEILPLPAVLARVSQSHPGEVLKVELERDHGRWIYELRILQGGGVLVRLDVDAKDATVIRRREGGR